MYVINKHAYNEINKHAYNEINKHAYSANCE